MGCATKVFLVGRSLMIPGIEKGNEKMSTQIIPFCALSFSLCQIET